MEKSFISAYYATLALPAPLLVALTLAAMGANVAGYLLVAMAIALAAVAALTNTIYRAKKYRECRIERNPRYRDECQKLYDNFITLLNGLRALLLSAVAMCFALLLMSSNPAALIPWLALLIGLVSTAGNLTFHWAFIAEKKAVDCAKW